MSTKTILAVDDEEHILELIRYNLENSGYKVVTAESGEEALEVLLRKKCDLVLLDWMLPGIDGIEVIKKIRENSELKKLPVILLTAKNEEINKVVGLEIGADDFLTKPFGIYELLARIKAVLRRSEDSFDKPETKEEILVIDYITINKARRTVEANGEPVELSLKEFDLLYLLAKNRGFVYSRDMLLEKVWGYDYEGETRTVDVHVSNLRKKLEKDDQNPKIIKTVRGVGYKIP